MTAPASKPTFTPATTVLEVDPQAYEAAVARVEEARSSGARLAVPGELRHREDRRLFLAVQLADAERQRHPTPHDEAELAQMIRRDELVEVPPLGEGFVLYQISKSVTLDPLVHFDTESGREVPLLGSLADYEAEAERLGRMRTARAREDGERLREWYEDPGRRQSLFEEHADLVALAADFRGRRYDLEDPADARRFQARLASFLSPAAHAVLLEVARAYQERFARPLPVSSLIRTERYQRRLLRRTSNATGVPVPPHTTGMAFDITYKYMATEEQNTVMEVLARLEAAGCVEALRERHNALHVYTFEHGPPGAAQVAQYFDEVEAAHPGSAPRPAQAAPARPARGGRAHKALGARAR
jgi:hypothetical protein